MALERNVDLLVIGAGQAGLALGYHLRAAGLRFLLVDRHTRIGDSWRQRYDSLVLFTPRAYSALPGLPVPGDPEGYPTKDEIADYLEQYTEHFALPVILDTGIRSLTRISGGFRARTDAGELIDACSVVVATGAFQLPAIPSVARELSPDVVQLTSESYKRPSQVANGTVLVVGDGATGRQIAWELAETGRHDVLLATGRPRRVSPARLFGRSLFWWMDKTGLLRASRETPIGSLLMRADPFPGAHLSLKRLRQHGIQVVGRMMQAGGDGIRFATGETREIATIIWATGYRDDSRWLTIPEAKDAQGSFVQRRGVSAVPGLYFVGRSWQWTRGAALLTGVGDDARYVVEQLIQHAPEKLPPAAAASALSLQ
ncbi:MAG TPA: NAD(P)/FAD-dependent oxidoreductase [Streptosporangiaceae bacterium]